MRRLQPITVAVCVLAVTALASCSKNPEAAVPRPHAYPRIALYDTAYRVVEAAPVCFDANASAEAECRPGACDIRYPRYGATVYVGIAAVKPENGSMAAHIENRLQRMALNLEGVPSHYAEVAVPPGCVARLVIADGPSATPVQLLYADTVRCIVASAAAFLHDGTLRGAGAVDSLRPVTGALAADLRRLAATIRPL